VRAWWRTHLRASASDRPSLRRSRLGTFYGLELDNVRQRLEALGVPSEDLADVAHDVFLELMEHPITRTAHWQLLPARLARGTYAAAHAGWVGRHDTEEMGREALNISDPGGSPDEIYDLHRMVRRALNAIDERFQIVLNLYLVRGRPQRDIARELGMSPAVVHQLVQEGRYKLRFRLEKELHKA
jgi:DNA-directed RNA polymerase specialized sigma24 family protein